MQLYTLVSLCTTHKPPLIPMHYWFKLSFDDSKYSIFVDSFVVGDWMTWVFIEWNIYEALIYMTDFIRVKLQVSSGKIWINLFFKTHCGLGKKAHISQTNFEIQFLEYIFFSVDSLKLFPIGPIDNTLALLLAMAWCFTCDKPIPEFGNNC